MCDKWEREWERYDNMGGFTMAECCEKADKADPDHEYETDEKPDDEKPEDDEPEDDEPGDDEPEDDNSQDDKS